MGLDMYLFAEKHVNGWEGSKDPQFDALVALFKVTPDSGSPSFLVSATVGYWRKANAIHRWFVDRVQEGKDECQRSYVSKEQLHSLRADCRKVLDSVEAVQGQVSQGTTYHADGRVEHHTKTGEVVAQAGVAEKILPTQAGFFFGKTEYDENYLADLRDTIDIIDRALEHPALEGCDFYYEASW
jgi:hypothetical protein